MRRSRHLKLVHSRSPKLTREQLAHFATPRTWDEIVLLDPKMSPKSWRDGVIDCDEYGFRLLTFARGDKSRKGAWSLTDKGRRYVARVTP